MNRISTQAARALPALFLVALFVTNSPSANADLILHYRGDNNALDSSGYGNHGALNNGTSYGSGVSGAAFVFDGSNDTVEGPVVTQLNNSAFTIAMFVKSAPNSGHRLLADTSHGGNRGGINHEGFALQLVNGFANLAVGNGSSFPSVFSSTAINDDQFHHVAGTFDGSQISIYIDGVLENTTAYTGTYDLSERNFRLGNHDQFTNRALNGSLDDVRLYNEALSGSQIAALAAIPEPGTGFLVCCAGLGMLMVRRKKI